MTAKKQKNTTSPKSKTSGNWEHFLLPQEYLDDKSARISTREGKTIYEIEIPFEIEDYREVSKEEYDQHVQETKAAREEKMEYQQDIYEQTQKHNKKLKEIWYISINSEERGDFLYEERLLDVLENKQIDHLKQIPWMVDNQTKENQMQLFQTLAKKEKVPDSYEQEIIAFLDTYKDTYENAPISNEQIIYISTLFVRWHIDNIQLYYRFEQLKSKKRKNYYKRMYLFWKERKGSVLAIQEKEFLDDEEMSLILYFLNNKGWFIYDMDDDENRFRNKVKTSYIHGMKEFRLGRWDKWFWKSYSGFEKKKLTRTLWFTDEDFNNWSEQAKKEFVNDFAQMITNMNIDAISFPLAKLQENIARISESTDTNDLKNTIKAWLKQCIVQWIQKILNKEKITTCAWKERKNLSYKYRIANMSKYIDILYIELEKLDGNEAKTTWWKENKAFYIQEYCDFHRDSFVEKRLLEVLKVDINDKEALETQLLQEVEAYFYTSCKKKIEKHWSDITPYNPLSTRMVIESVINAFFRTGYGLVLKKLYPNDQERKTLRQKYVQTISKNIVSDINGRLTNLSTFSLTEHYMREPIVYLYHKYWWQEDLLATQQRIETTYQQYLESVFLKNWAELMEKIENTFASDTSLDISKSYSSITDFSVFVEKHIWAMIKRHAPTYTYKRLDESIQQNKMYNEKNTTLYPDWLINDFSFHWHILEDIEHYLSANILTQCIDWYTTIDMVKPQILQPILQWWFTKNSQSGGKLQRLSQEIIIKNFGILTLSQEQTDFLLAYFSEHLGKIILNDLALSTDWVDLFWSDKELIQEYIHQYIDNMKQYFIWLSDNNKLIV